MAAGFGYFTSDDAGAPTLSAAAGQMIAVLDWVLVGKGGWAKVFSGTNLAVYRSGSGNRFFLRVDDTQAKYVRYRGYRNMTAISTGTGQFPTNTQATNINTWGVAKGYTAGTAPRRYWGVRTNRYVVMFIESYGAPDGASVSQIGFFCFGDVPSLCESDSHNTVIVGCNDENAAAYFPSPVVSGSSLATPDSSIGGSNLTVAFSGTPDGAVTSPASALVGPWGHTTSLDVNTQQRISLAGRMFFAPLTFYSTGDTGGSTGVYPRARLPNIHFVYGGVYGVPHTLSPCYYEEVFTLNGRQFRTMCDYNSPANPRWAHGTLLEMSDTDGAL